jgi:hypothetical protein
LNNIVSLLALLRDDAADDMTELFDFSNPASLVPPALGPQPVNGICGCR